MDYLFGAELTLKATNEGEGSFEGFAAIFDKKDRGMDIILPGAFTKSLHGRKPKKVKMLLQHDQKDLIGMWDHFEETEKGLFAKGHLILDLPKAEQTHRLMKEGLLDSLSIGFITIVDAWDSKKVARILHEVDLLEVSPVAIPMQADAVITAVKSVGPDNIITKRDLEGVLRDAGFSKALAAYVCAGWTPPARRDDEGETSDLLGSLRGLRVSMKPA